MGGGGCCVGHTHRRIVARVLIEGHQGHFPPVVSVNATAHTPAFLLPSLRQPLDGDKVLIANDIAKKGSGCRCVVRPMSRLSRLGGEDRFRRMPHQ